MKRISRSLLSLCLAFVLCAAAVLSGVNTARANGEESTAVAPNQIAVILYDYRL